MMAVAEKHMDWAGNHNRTFSAPDFDLNIPIIISDDTSSTVGVTHPIAEAPLIA